MKKVICILLVVILISCVRESEYYELENGDEQVQNYEDLDLAPKQIEEIDHEEKFYERNIFEFISSDENFFIRSPNDFNSIANFNDYFIVENNIIKIKNTLHPFAGEIILNQRLRANNEIAMRFKFIDGFMSEYKRTFYRWNGTVLSVSRANVFTFFDEQNRMRYHFDLLEERRYFDITLPDGTLVNNLIFSSVARNKERPGGLY